MLLISVVSFGQTKSISGKVSDKADGKPLPGVSVVVVGSTNGTITDLEGKFNLTVNAADILRFSFIGMRSQEISVENRSIFNVSLELATQDLDEFVVIGYGVQKKKDITGSVSLVTSETIEDLKPIKVEQALMGTATGVNVTSQSGSPGAGLDIRIRGIGTNGDASPVAIIDGYIGDLNTLSPDDIESVTVLKDAQAAIYGTIGANGIILVKTKSGKRNTPTKVTFNSSYGIQESSRVLPVLNATEYAVLLNESYAASGKDVPFKSFSGLGIGTNWQNAIFQQAPISNNSITISGGSDNMAYSVSASDLGQKGIIGGDKSGFRRNTARTNMDVSLAKNLKLNTSLIYTSINRKSLNEFGLGFVLFNDLNMPSSMPVKNSEGAYFLAPTSLGIEIINPLAQIENTFNDYNLNKLNGSFGLNYEVTTNLVATARIGFNTTYAGGKSLSKIVNYGGKVFDVSRSSVNEYKDNFNDYTFDAFLNYNNTFGDGNGVTFTLGTTVFKTWGSHLDGTGYDIPNNSWEFASIGLAQGISDTKSTNSWIYDQRRLSYFSRFQYDYQGKYLVSAMFRRDASTKFGPDNSVAYFPSATLGWIFSEEKVLRDNPILNFGKFRLSYGLLGSDKIGDYQYISQLSGEATYVFDDKLVFGKAVGASPNPSVSWEAAEQFDVGLDLRFLKNKIDVSTDYFVSTRQDLLIGNIPVSGILGIAAPGASGPTVNAGTVRNSGFELAVGYKETVNKDFSYGINFNLTTLKNNVLEVNNGSGFIEGGSFGVGQPAPARMEVGFPIGYFYGYKTDGVFQSQQEVDDSPSQLALGAEAVPGDLKFVDIYKDGKIDSKDRTFLGSPIPDATIGLNINIKYGNFDFIAYAFSSIGNEMCRNYERVQPNANKLKMYLGRWTGAGTSNDIPRLTTAATANTIFSDFYVEDASFVRLQNIQLGYTLPGYITQKAKISEARVFASADNLFTLTKYMGYDPAASNGAPIGGGIDAGFYPSARIYTVGLNVNF